MEFNLPRNICCSRDIYETIGSSKSGNSNGIAGIFYGVNGTIGIIGTASL